jgi:hypothetical protein
MAITFLESNSNEQNSSSSTITASFTGGSGVQAGDQLIAVVSIWDVNGNPTVGSVSDNLNGGYSRIAGHPESGNGFGGGDVGVYQFKNSLAGGPPVNVTANLNGVSSTTVAYIYLYRLSGAGDLDVVLPNDGSGGSGATLPSIGTLTTNGADFVLAVAIINETNDNQFTGDADLPLVQNFGDSFSDGNGGFITVGNEAAIQIGAGDITANWSNPVTSINDWTGIMVAISPAALGHSISGTVSGDVADGVLMTLSGDASATTTTAGGGLYSFGSLPDGNYVVTPSLAGYTFSPTSRSLTLSGSDLTGENFTSTLIVPYSVPDCRVAPFGPNTSRTVQGTKIYDVQTSSNSAVPGTDSRAVGAPVDSRVSAPQNSRTPGTFGPGE